MKWLLEFIWGTCVWKVQCSCSAHRSFTVPILCTDYSQTTACSSSYTAELRGRGVSPCWWGTEPRGCQDGFLQDHWGLQGLYECVHAYKLERGGWRVGWAGWGWVGEGSLLAFSFRLLWHLLKKTTTNFDIYKKKPTSCNISCLFQHKLYTAPPSHAQRLYALIISHLEAQYTQGYNTSTAATMRKAVSASSF